MPPDFRDHALATACILGVFGDEDDGTGRTYSQAYEDEHTVDLEDMSVEIDRDWSDFNFGRKKRR